MTDAAGFHYTFHPAVYSKAVLERFTEVLADRVAATDRYPVRVLDPFAGTGRIHTLAGDDVSTTGVEIQPQWAELHPCTMVGDATALPEQWSNTWDVVMTSPAYGNRFADKHKAKDGSLRRSYTHDLRRMTGDPELELEANNTGRYLFETKQYKRLHEKAWREVWRVLRPGGWFVLNVSDSIRNDRVVPVCQWHHDFCTDIGFDTIRILEIETPRLRYGRNSSARTAFEMIYVMEKR